MKWPLFIYNKCHWNISFDVCMASRVVEVCCIFTEVLTAVSSIKSAHALETALSLHYAIQKCNIYIYILGISRDVCSVIAPEDVLTMASDVWHSTNNSWVITCSKRFKTRNAKLQGRFMFDKYATDHVEMSSYCLSGIQKPACIRDVWDSIVYTCLSDISVALFNYKLAW